MAYLNIAKIGETEIITGFTPPSIDPVETKKVVAVEMEKTDVFKRRTKIHKQVSRIYQERQSILNRIGPLSAGLRDNPDDEKIKLEIEKLRKQFIDTNPKLAKMEILNNEVKPEYDAEYRRLFDKHCIRFSIPGCTVISENEKQKIKEEMDALEPGQHLTPQLNIITDRRGQTYFAQRNGKWVDTTITTIDHRLPDDAKLTEELTDDDRASIMASETRDAIKMMTPASRNAARQRALDGVRDAAVIKERGFHLDGFDDSEERAKMWLKDEKQKIEELYDVTS
jgi:hypothetical protein